MNNPHALKRDLLVSKAWLQAVAIVILFGFFILGFLAYRTYTGEAPIPARVVDPAGAVLFTHDDILGGQQVFLRNGLMEYGSIFGHGAYLGPDFTADYLRRAATSVLNSYGGAQSDQARGQTIQEFKVNRYDPTSDTQQPGAVPAIERTLACARARNVISFRRGDWVTGNHGLCGRARVWKLV